MQRWTRILLGLVALGVFGILLVAREPRESGGSGAVHLPPARPGAKLPGSPALPAPPLASAEGLAATLAGQVQAAEAELEWLLPLAGEGYPTMTAAAARTGSGGWFRLAVPPGKAGILVIRAPGFPPLRHEATPPGPGQLLDLGPLEPHPGVELELRVTDRREGRPVPAAVVQAIRPAHPAWAGDEGCEATTDPEGRARLAPLGRGPWELHVRAPGFSPFQGRVAVDPGLAPAAWEVFLESGPGLGGIVRDDTGRPVPGALVQAAAVRRGEGDERGRTLALAGSGGEFHLPGLAEGEWSLQAFSNEGATARPQRVEVPRPGLLTLETRPRPSVRGRVVAGEEGLAGVQVALARPRDRSGLWLLAEPRPGQEVDEQGGFHLRPLVAGPGPWVVVAWGPGRLPGECDPFPLEPGDDPGERVVLLPRGGWVEGRFPTKVAGQVRLEDATRLPLPPFLAAQPPPEVRVEPDGAFRLGPLTPGPQRLLLEARGLVPRIQTVSVEAGKTTQLGTVQLASGIVVQGVLLGPSGRPEPGGLIWLVPATGDEPVQAWAGEGGRFSFPPLPPGRYTLKARRRGADAFTALRDFGATAREVDLGRADPLELEAVRIPPL